jgi:adenylate kinase family enzyme
MNQALLLIGPTGSGKTPLGDAMQAAGLWGRCCHHFDFGQQLRNVGEGRAPEGLFDAPEVAFVRSVLEAGVLLEDEQFPIAEKLVLSFLDERGAAVDDVVVLNGMPRHAGQATAVEDIVDVAWVVSLECTPEVVLARIGANTGGDRTGRTDDGLDAVREKLAVFRERTAPLVAHYRQWGTPVLELVVGAATAAGDLVSRIEGAFEC